MAEDLPEEIPEQPRFTVRQQRFIEEFCVSGNCTQAAKAAGYSPDTAYSIGSRLLKHVEIKAAVDERLAALSLDALTATKLISDIAQSSINEFLKIEEVEEPTRVAQPLGDFIAEIQAEIVFEDEFARRAKLGKKEMKQHQGTQVSRRRKIIRLQLRLENDPEASHMIAGPPVLVKRAQLDMVKLAEAREGGRIDRKSVV